MTVKVPWKRLIRFVNEEDGQVYFGDAVLPSPDFDIGSPENSNSLEAKILSGDPLSSTCTVQDRVVKVKRLLAPLTAAQVPAIRCIGGNYKSHSMSWRTDPAPESTYVVYHWQLVVAELNIDTPKYPLMFGKFSNAIAGHGDDIPITKLIQDEQVDYEAELAVVIGKDCKDASVEDAWQYVLGYTCANDLSARFGCQWSSHRCIAAKHVTESGRPIPTWSEHFPHHKWHLRKVLMDSVL